MRALWLPDRLREFKLEPVEVAGWQTRGKEDANFRGSVNHHTAGGPGYFPSGFALVNGRKSPPLSGPLCNVGEPRVADDDWRVFIIAAGVANHAGEGNWKGLSGNHSVLGLEREHSGSINEPTSLHQFDVACRVHAAFARGGDFSSAYVCEHKEWAPKRKIDYINENGSVLRERTDELLSGKEDAEVINDWVSAQACEQNIEALYMMAYGRVEPTGFQFWYEKCLNGEFTPAQFRFEFWKAVQSTTKTP